MPELADVLFNDPMLQWRVGRIESINYNSGIVGVVMGAAGDPSPNIMRINRAAFLGSYVPQMYDVVHVLFQVGIGALVLGSPKMSGQVPSGGGGGGGGGGTVWFTGNGPPSDPYPGASAGDLYLDNLTGNYYRLFP